MYLYSLGQHLLIALRAVAETTQEHLALNRLAGLRGTQEDIFLMERLAAKAGMEVPLPFCRRCVSEIRPSAIPRKDRRK